MQDRPGDVGRVLLHEPEGRPLRLGDRGVREKAPPRVHGDLEEGAHQALPRRSAVHQLRGLPRRAEDLQPAPENPLLQHLQEAQELPALEEVHQDEHLQGEEQGVRGPDPPQRHPPEGAAAGGAGVLPATRENRDILHPDPESHESGGLQALRPEAEGEDPRHGAGHRGVHPGLGAEEVRNQHGDVHEENANFEGELGHRREEGAPADRG